MDLKGPVFGNPFCWSSHRMSELDRPCVVFNDYFQFDGLKQLNAEISSIFPYDLVKSGFLNDLNVFNTLIWCKNVRYNDRNNFI